MKSRTRVFSSLFLLCAALAAHAETVTLSVPGPGSLSYLPVYLAKAIAADQAEGLKLKLRDLNDNNSEFAAAGLPAIAPSRADGMPVLAIGQLGQSAMFVFMLRADLKNQVRNIAQLKGKRIGNASSTKTARSMGAMMTGYLLRRAGSNSGDVQHISAGQSRDSTRAALSSGTVDAMPGDEPFASELVAQGIAVKLAGQPGFDATTDQALMPILRRNNGMYTQQCAWNMQAVANTERFFHVTSEDPGESQLPFNTFIRN